MKAVTLKQAKLNLEEVVARVLADAEPTIVVAENGEQVVVLPRQEYDSWKETLDLLSSPAHAERLRRSIAKSADAEVTRRLNEVFRDPALVREQAATASALDPAGSAWNEERW